MTIESELNEIYAQLIAENTYNEDEMSESEKDILFREITFI